jgi:hypothetical protein
MRPESFKNYCPECGEEITLTKDGNGNFRCPVCDCEYGYNWRVWVLVGIPTIALGVWMIGSIAGWWNAPSAIAFLCGVILTIIFWIWGHRGYVILKHGHDPADSKDNIHQA